MTTGSLTFRVHPKIIHTEPAGSRDYGDHMPQNLTIFASDASGSVVHDKPFLYYYRSTMIAFMVLEHLCVFQSEKDSYLLTFLKAACGSSGLGYCYEYFSIRGLVNPDLTTIQVSVLSKDR